MRILIAVVLLLGLTHNCYAGRPIDTIIIHHTASHDASAKEIDGWHKERGWDGIGYHYVIRADGSIEEGRDVEKVGAHAKGRNTGSIGIALTGYDKFTDEQRQSLYSLVRKLSKKYSILAVERHHKLCPGNSLDVERIKRIIL